MPGYSMQSKGTVPTPFPIPGGFIQAPDERRKTPVCESVWARNADIQPTKAYHSHT